MALNEVGDFLAGFFAPLAFIWLVTAVLIQSRELELQQEEIREGRRVAEKSAEAAKKQAEVIEKQLQYTLQQENDEYAKAILWSFVTAAKAGDLSTIKYKEKGTAFIYPYEFIKTYPSNLSEALFTIGARMRSLEGYVFHGDWELRGGGTIFAKWGDKFDEITRLTYALTPSARAELSGYPLEEIRQLLNRWRTIGEPEATT